MRRYDVTVKFQEKGRGYPREEKIVAYAGSVKTAATRALEYAAAVNRQAGHWREPVGAVVTVSLMVGAMVPRDRRRFTVRRADHPEFMPSDRG